MATVPLVAPGDVPVAEVAGVRAEHARLAHVDPANAPDVTDPTTIACVSDPKKGVLAKTAAAIDKACFTAPATAPSCYTTIGGTSGAIWANAFVSGGGSTADDFISVINCGSPSGAFLD